MEPQIRNLLRGSYAAKMRYNFDSTEFVASKAPIAACPGRGRVIRRHELGGGGGPTGAVWITIAAQLSPKHAGRRRPAETRHRRRHRPHLGTASRAVLYQCSGATGAVRHPEGLRRGVAERSVTRTVVTRAELRTAAIPCQVLWPSRSRTERGGVVTGTCQAWHG